MLEEPWSYALFQFHIKALSVSASKNVPRSTYKISICTSASHFPCLVDIFFDLELELQQQKKFLCGVTGEQVLTWRRVHHGRIILVTRIFIPCFSGILNLFRL